MTRVTVQVFPGAVAALAALLLGGAVWATLGTLVLFVIAYDPRPRVRAAALLAAPILLSLGTPLESLFTLDALVWIPLALGAAAPFFIAHGDAVPWRRLVAILLLVLVLVGSVVVFRWGPTWLDSDIAARAQVLLLAAATLLVWSVQPYLPGRPTQKSSRTARPTPESAPEARTPPT
ncbi:MAG: hypothetical protein KY455_09650 [Euryarchaeota archaeon]|nr:hypothetical protein [Euryarchaeota archaeon]